MEVRKCWSGGVGRTIVFWPPSQTRIVHRALQTGRGHGVWCFQVYCVQHPVLVTINRGNRRRWRAAAEAYSCPTHRNSRSRGQCSSDFRELASTLKETIILNSYRILKKYILTMAEMTKCDMKSGLLVTSDPHGLISQLCSLLYRAF